MLVPSTTSRICPPAIRGPLLALIPPLWFRVLNPRVEAWAEEHDNHQPRLSYSTLMLARALKAAAIDQTVHSSKCRGGSLLR